MRAKAALFLLRLLSLLPLRVMHVLGALIGSVLYYLPNKLRSVATRNIALCFPELSISDQRKLLQQALRENVKTFTEIGAMWFWPKHKMQALNQGVDGLQHVEEAQKQGKGVIVLTPHLGQWEYLGAVFPEIMPMTSMYRPMRMPGLEQAITQGRERFGNSMAPANAKGVKAVFAALKRSELVCILPDQSPAIDSGLYAPFFGQDTFTMFFVSRLAIKTDAVVLITYAERLAKGKGYRLVIRPVDKRIHDKPLEASVAVMNGAVESLIREKPNQYQWIYKRFKQQPEGVVGPYQ